MATEDWLGVFVATLFPVIGIDPFAAAMLGNIAGFNAFLL